MRTRLLVAMLTAAALITAGAQLATRTWRRAGTWLLDAAAAVDRPAAYRGRHRVGRGAMSTLDSVAVSIRAQQAEIAALIAEGHRVHADQTPAPLSPPMYPAGRELVAA
jgi:hypothetical protein